MTNNQNEAIPIDRTPGRPKLEKGEKKIQIMLSGIPQKHYKEAYAAAEAAVKPFKEAQ